MNSLIGDSRVRGLKSGKLANLIDDQWCLPGAKLTSLDEAIKDVVILHHGEDEYDGKLNIYIAAGICDITTRLKAKKYEEVIFDTSSKDSTVTKVKEVLTSLNQLTIEQNAIPIFCTIYPMNLMVWNTNRLNKGKTFKLLHADDYKIMQRELESAIENINNHIFSLNKSNLKSTPNLHNILRRNRGKGNHSFKYSLLTDGCHPNNQMKNNIRISLAQAISKNRKTKTL